MTSSWEKLLEPRGLAAAEIRDWLAPVGFSDLDTALARLRGLVIDLTARAALARCLPMLMAILQESATPDLSVLNFERFVQSVPDRLELLTFLAENQRAVEVLVRLFVGSQFLTEILLRHPEYLRELAQHKRLAEFKAREEFVAEAEQLLDRLQPTSQQLDAVRRFQHWELLRIGACDTFGLMDFKSVTLQLSLLADAMVQVTLGILAREQSLSTSDLCVLAFGKLGGEELNYSSDIDLVFVAASDESRYWSLGQKLIKALSDTTAEGFMYRVDMRLRPWGKSGPLVSSVDGYVTYLQEQAALWEKQALLKARPIAGNLPLGEAFLRRIDPIVFGVSIDDARENVRSMKQKIEAELRRKGRLSSDVKSGPGAIRDIEFLTQFLQLSFGRSQKDVRSRNTLDGLIRLADLGCIQPGEYRRLTAAYVLFRTIEHSLQLMHYGQVHQLPTDERELQYLSRRLDFLDAAAFLKAFGQYREDIRRIYLWYIEPVELSGTGEHVAVEPAAAPRHLDLMDPAYATAFEADEIARHGALWNKLSPEKPIDVEAVSLPDGCVRLTVCGVDQKGHLALICGLLFAYGFDIVRGHAFTAAQKLVDSLVLRRASDAVADDALWERYRGELLDLVRLGFAQGMPEAQGKLAERVAEVIRHSPAPQSVLLPLVIDIDNAASERFTVLGITGEDTPGFLYELANALSLLGFNIHRVIIQTVEGRAHDTLFVEDPQGQKVLADEDQARLRATIVLVKHFTHLLPQSSHPQHALLHFRQFLQSLFEKPDWSAALASLDRQEVLETLARVLGVSDFLWDDFLRLQHDNLFPVIRDVERLNERKSREELRAELASELEALATPSSLPEIEERRRRLNAFKDREMFRVDMRHIAGKLADFADFSRELTDVAEVVVQAAFELCWARLVSKHGTPQTRAADPLPISMTVVALGKAGGAELGFASDIELMFLYGDNGHTTGLLEDSPRSSASAGVISATEFFTKLVDDFCQTITAKRQGIFEIDLRLRPFGSAGPVAVSVDAFESYFGPTGPAWPYERQALVKLRPIAGDVELGQRVVAIRDRLLYSGQAFDLVAMRAMRERQLRQLVKPGTLNAKLSMGGLVDCEYLVQALQITFGHTDARLRATNTLEAMLALHATGLLSNFEFQELSMTYRFIRRLIDALRVVRGDARDLDVPEPSSPEFVYLARRLGYEDRASDLKADIDATLLYVVALSRVIASKIESPSPDPLLGSTDGKAEAQIKKSAAP